MSLIEPLTEYQSSIINEIMKIYPTLPQGTLVFIPDLFNPNNSVLQDVTKEFLEEIVTIEKDATIMALDNISKEVTLKQKEQIAAILLIKDNKCLLDATSPREFKKLLKNISNKQNILKDSNVNSKKLFSAIQKTKYNINKIKHDNMRSILNPKMTRLSKIGIDAKATGLSTGISILVNVGDLLNGRYSDFFFNVGKDTSINVTTTMLLGKGIENKLLNKIPGVAGVLVHILADGCMSAYSGDWHRFGLNIPKHGINTAASIGGAAIGTKIAVCAGIANPLLGAGLALVGGITCGVLSNKTLEYTPLGGLTNTEKVNHAKNFIVTYNSNNTDGWLISEDVNLLELYGELQKKELGKIPLVCFSSNIKGGTITQDNILALAKSYGNNLDVGLNKILIELQKAAKNVPKLKSKL